MDEGVYKCTSKWHLLSVQVHWTANSGSTSVLGPEAGYLGRELDPLSFSKDSMTRDNAQPMLWLHRHGKIQACKQACTR